MTIVAVCCFNNADAIDASPILIWYVPMDDGLLHVPALDGHTGDSPSRGSEVLVDHWIIAGSHRFTNGIGKEVSYRATGTLK